MRRRGATTGSGIATDRKRTTIEFLGHVITITAGAFLIRFLDQVGHKLFKGVTTGITLKIIYGHLPFLFCMVLDEKLAGTLLMLSLRQAGEVKDSKNARLSESFC